jgi:hypothetical protein
LKKAYSSDIIQKDAWCLVATCILNMMEGFFMEMPEGFKSIMKAEFFIAPDGSLWVKTTNQKGEETSHRLVAWPEFVTCP